MEVVATFNSILANMSMAGVVANTSKLDGVIANLSKMDGMIASNMSQLDHREVQGVLEQFRSNFYLHREPITIVLISLYLPIFLLAFLGNLLVLVVVLPNKHMRSLTNCFIVNLAAADMLGKYHQLGVLKGAPSLNDI